MVHGLGHFRWTPDMSIVVLRSSPQHVHQRPVADSVCPALVDKLSRMSSMSLFPDRANLYCQLCQYKQRCRFIVLKSSNSPTNVRAIQIHCSEILEFSYRIVDTHSCATISSKLLYPPNDVIYQSIYLVDNYLRVAENGRKEKK